MPKDVHIDIPDFDAIFRGDLETSPNQRLHPPQSQSHDPEEMFRGDSNDDQSAFNILQQIMPAHLQVQVHSVDPQGLDPFNHAAHSHYPFVAAHWIDNAAGPSIPKMRRSAAEKSDQSLKDDYSDLLVSPERQAEMMADP